MKRLFLALTFILAVLLVSCNEDSAAPEEIPGETIVDTVYVDRIDTLIVDNTDTLIVNRYHDIVERDTLFTDPECTTSEIDGLVTVTCGSKHTLVYKGSCDSISYDPTKDFCYQGNILDFCGGFSYDPSRYFCSNDSLVQLCNGSSYDLSTLFCDSDSLIVLCNGKGYDVTRQFCFNDSIYDFCEGKRYNPDSTSCNFTKVDTLVMRDTLFIDPDCITTEVDGLVTVTCGSKSTLVYKGACDSISYDPAKSFCYEGKIFDLCGDKPYDPFTHFCDERDGQIYRMVTIGEQTWMAENLNYAYIEPTTSLDSSSFCPNDDASECDKYGRLYLWSAAMDSSAVFSNEGKDCGDDYRNPYSSGCVAKDSVRGVCPMGWHLPSNAECETLFTTVGGTDEAGKKLKSNSGWLKGYNGDDSYGFAVLPAGYREYDGGFTNVDSTGYFWTSTPVANFKTNTWYFFTRSSEVSRLYNNRNYGFSIRCVKD